MIFTGKLHQATIKHLSHFPAVNSKTYDSKTNNYAVISFSFFLIFTVMLLYAPGRAQGAAAVSFTWQANPEAVDGYRLYYRTSSGGIPYTGTGATEGPSPVDTGDVTSFTLHGLSESETYYFALTAYIGSQESGYTQEVILFPAPNSNILPIAAAASFRTTKNIAVTGYLSAADPDNDPLTYTIVNNGSLGSAVITSPSSGAFRYTPSPGAAGSDSFTFKANDGTGDSNQATVSVFIEALNQPPAAVIATSAATGAAPFNVRFDATSSRDSDGSVSGYTWNFGDGLSASGSVVSHSYPTPGNYTARLTVTDNNGATGSAVTPIVVTSQVNLPPQALISISPDRGVIPLTITFDAAGSRDPDGRIDRYSWNFGDGTTASGISVNHLYRGAGRYTATLEVEDDQGVLSRVSRTITAYIDENSLAAHEAFPWNLFLPIFTGSSSPAPVPEGAD